MENIKGLKPIDNVTVDILDVAFRAVGIRLEKSIVDKIIDIIELIEDNGIETSLMDIAELEKEWSISLSKI